MHCDQCGKENRADSKFCRYCGTPTEGSDSTSSAKRIGLRKLILISVAALIVLGGVLFGAYKAYAYSRVESKINLAKKLQSGGDFSGSLSALSSLGGYSLTRSQSSEINLIKNNDQKFLAFKASFNAATTLDAGSPTSANLQAALDDLQSIDTSYPYYKAVQAEITKVQNLLVSTLQSENTASAQAATAAKAEAVSATAAKAKAEADAEQAENDVNTAASLGEAADAEQSFINQLSNIYSNLSSNCVDNLTQAIDDYSAGEDDSVYLGAAASGCSTAESDAKNLNSSFENMPSSYVDAADDLEWAAYYDYESEISFVGGDYSTAETYADDAEPYAGEVSNFLTDN